MEWNRYADYFATTATASHRGAAAAGTFAPVMRAFCVALLGVVLTVSVFFAPFVATGAQLAFPGAREAASCADGWVLRFEHGVPTVQDVLLSCAPAVNIP